MLKYIVYVILIMVFISCKAPSLNYGERYLIKNYEKKRRKKIKKYLDYRQVMLKKVKKY